MVEPGGMLGADPEFLSATPRGGVADDEEGATGGAGGPLAAVEETMGTGETAAGAEGGKGDGASGGVDLWGCRQIEKWPLWLS